MITPILTNILTPIITNIYKSVVNPDFHYPLGGDALNRYKSAGSTRYATLSTPITLAIGDSVEFTYDATGPMTASRFFIYSSSGASNVGYFGAGSGAHGNAQLSSFTCTMNGVAVTAGDDLIDNNPTQFPVKGYLPVRIVLTATAETDIEYILANNSGASIQAMNFYNLKVVTVAQTYNWPMATIGSATQAEADADPINVVFTANDPAYWSTWPFVDNSGTSSIVQHLTSNDVAGGDKLTQEDSLRADSTGNSTGFTSAEYYITRGDQGIPYASGFVIDCLVKYNGHYNGGTTHGRGCGVVQALSTTSINSLWAMRFDNFDDPTDSDVYPTFTIVARDALYHQATAHYSTIVAEIRSSTAAVIGTTYRLTGFIGDEISQFWINGVSVGTAAIASTWYDAGGDPAKDVLDGSQDTVLNIGPCVLNGSWRTGQDTEIQDVKIYLLEATQSFIDSI